MYKQSCICVYKVALRFRSENPRKMFQVTPKTEYPYQIIRVYVESGISEYRSSKVYLYSGWKIYIEIKDIYKRYSESM